LESDVEVRVPDLIEPFVAWRTWDVCVEGNDLLLESLFFATVWHPGGPLRATCQYGCPVVPGVEHIDPETYGSTVPCGIYAGKQLAQAAGYLPDSLRCVGGPPLFQKRTRAVIGKVALWGLVKEHKMGYRAEYAKPVALWVPVSFGFPVGGNEMTPERVARSLSATYEVPAKLFRHTRDLEDV
jgi:hypothetical protein